MQVHIDGKPLPPLRSRKSLWLLALLALRGGRSVERIWLSETLWPETDHSRAARNLRVVLSELRHALGPESRRLQSPSHHTLAFDLAGADVDTCLFDAAIVSQDHAALRQAVALYRGPLLAGCSEEWAAQERRGREEDCLRGLQTLADAALIAANYADAVTYFQRTVDIDPWRESAQRGLIQALSAKGEINAALNVYQTYVRFLRRDDPWAAPDEKTTALYSSLRAEARRKSSTAKVLAVTDVASPLIMGYLPHALTDLVGRDDERREVAERLRESRLVTLTGPGGIGKTRLAIEAARQVAGDYPNGVWLVTLEALSNSEQIVGHVADVLNIKENSGRTLLESLISHMQNTRLLLVLDNCEHLLEDIAKVSGHLLQKCAGVRILATSRAALGIVGEIAWAVPSLAIPDPAHLPPTPATLVRMLGGYEGVQLFVERAQAVQKDFTLTRGNALAVAQVCAHLEGIPLAIELAAARVRSLTVTQIASRLDDHLSLLTDGCRTALPRQQTLRATLDWSYTLLGEAERLLLQRLSVFAGGWTLEAAEQVCAGTSVRVGHVLNLLTYLRDKSLVTFEAPSPQEEHTGGGRYRLLEMVRQYAADRLRASEEQERVQARHWAWCLGLVENQVPRLRGTEGIEAVQRLEAEHDNLRMALVWVAAKATGAEAELQMTSLLWKFWSRRGHYAEGRMYLEAVLKREEAQIGTIVRARALQGAGALSFHQGDYRSARTFLEEGIGLFRKHGDNQGVAEVLSLLGNMASVQGNFVEARAFYQESLDLSENLGDNHGTAKAFTELGNLALRRSDFDSARASYDESLRIHRELGGKAGIALALGNLGNVIHHSGDPVAARVLLEESLRLRRELSDRRGIMWTLGALGHLTQELGDPLAAQALFEESHTLAQALGSRQIAAWSLIGLGTATLSLGSRREALAMFEESLRIARELQDKRGIAQSLQGLAGIAYEQGDYAAALAHYGASLTAWADIGDTIEIAKSILEIAAVRFAQRHPEASVRLLASLQAAREKSTQPLPGKAQEKYERLMDQARASLDENAFAAAWEEGRALTWEQATADVLNSP